jgi:hypothetical protein
VELSCGFLVVRPAHGWSVLRSTHGGLTLASPRDVGTLHLSSVLMPEELGEFDVTKLWKRAERGPPRIHGRPFDLAEWIDGEISGIAFSTVHPGEAADEVLVRRDWCIASGRRVVDAFYTTPQWPDVVYINPTDKRDRRTMKRWRVDSAADLLDCEEMIRAAVFDRATM